MPTPRDELPVGIAEVEWDILPPVGLTKGGQERKFASGSTDIIYGNVKAAVDERARLLREDIYQSYVRRSSKQTAESVIPHVSVSAQSVTGEIGVTSPAVRFITFWGGNYMMPFDPPMASWEIPIPGVQRRTEAAPNIFPQSGTQLGFIGREGYRVLAPGVHHPGFQRDVISEHMEALKVEVERAVIDSIKESSIQWAGSLGQPERLRRQYRYSTPAGR